ncbi:Uncharacterized mitochondrial protein AtMg00310, partial [Linum grandiflorum]
LKGIKISRHAPVISDIFFADDSFLYLELNSNSIRFLKNMFDQYPLVSGQKINFNKSSIYFSHNTPHALQVSYAQILGVKASGLEDKYLGIPTLTPRSKRGMFKFLEDKIRKKLVGSKATNLSSAGKETLIKSVTLAFPAYAMSCFRLPNDICHKFDSLVANFWWGGSQDKKPIHRIKWTKLSRITYLGGLGFRDFKAFNQTLLAKQGWWLCQDLLSLAGKLLKRCYFLCGSFLKADLGSSMSLIWRSLLFGRELLLYAIQWQLGNGKSFDPVLDP